MGERAAVAAARALAEVVPRLARLIAGALETDAEVALSLRQYRILERLAERPHRTTELASTSGVSQPTASAAVASLEARGLVTREPAPDDRRATRILLTPPGQATFTTAKRRVLERLMLVTSDIGGEDAEALQRLQPVLLEGMDRAREELLAERAAGDRPRGT
jgi:DNA-binding MarR family transcriptional regulator